MHWWVAGICGFAAVPATTHVIWHSSEGLVAPNALTMSQNSQPISFVAE